MRAPIVCFSLHVTYDPVRQAIRRRSGDLRAVLSLNTWCNICITETDGEVRAVARANGAGWGWVEGAEGRGRRKTR